MKRLNIYIFAFCVLFLSCNIYAQKKIIKSVKNTEDNLVSITDKRAKFTVPKPASTPGIITNLQAKHFNQIAAAKTPVINKEKHPKLIDRIRISDPAKAVLSIYVGNPGLDKADPVGIPTTQVLIADGSTVDDNPASMDAFFALFHNGGQDLVNFYNILPYKIPDNADVSLNYSHGIVEESVTIEITPGVYDIIFAGIDSTYQTVMGFNNAVPEAFIDNLNCEAGWRYVFSYEYLADIPYVNEYPPVDIQTINVKTTPSSAILGLEPISITVLQNGNKDVRTLDFFYKINDRTPVFETVTFPIGSELGFQQTYTHTFGTLADLSAAGDYLITAWVEIADDYDLDNNEMTIIAKHTEPAELPFFDPFDENLSNWVVIDRNGTDEDDGGTWIPWTVYDNDWNPSNYYALYQYASDRPGDDWLRTIRPYHLTAGDHFISFTQANMGLPEKMNVYYGSDTTLNSMTLLAQIEIENALMATNIINFNNATDGNYYFAFQAVSDADMFAIILDNVRIEKGTAMAKPDLNVFQMDFKSYPSCELSDSVQVIVYNTGDVGSVINNFDLKYKLNNNGWNTLNVNATLNLEEGIRVKIGGLDMSATGIHTLTVAGELENQLTLSNDTLTGTIEKTPVITQLPYVSYFTNPADIDQWVMLTKNSWSVDKVDGNPVSISPNWSDEPLISRCIEFEAGTYKLSHTFTAGIVFPMFSMDGDYCIKLGEGGSNPEEWTNTIGALSSITVSADTTVTHVFEIAETGTYSIAFSSTSGFYNLKNVRIEKEKTGIENSVVENEITISPNPAKDFIVISSKNTNIENVTVFNSTGQTIFISPSNIESLNFALSINNWNKGIYIALVKTENENRICKFIVE
jgi:hypothetical protein